MKQTLQFLVSRATLTSSLSNISPSTSWAASITVFRWFMKSCRLYSITIRSGVHTVCPWTSLYRYRLTSSFTYFLKAPHFTVASRSQAAITWSLKPNLYYFIRVWAVKHQAPEKLLSQWMRSSPWNWAPWTRFRISASSIWYSEYSHLGCGM